MAIAAQDPDGSAALDEPYPVSRRRAWLTFALTFGLMVSDYASRQLINPMFPFLKAEWALSDTQLGSLVSVVALTMGLATIPISLVADRVGRVKSVAVMALVWSLATVACGLSDSFLALVMARGLVGLGEAGYGSAGAAILTNAFPARVRSTLMGAFLAAGMIGSVLGIVAGGLLAQSLGWRAAFVLVGACGMAVAIVFPFVVKEQRSASSTVQAKLPARQVLGHLLATPTLLLVALAGGCALFVQAAYFAWLPSYLNRYYAFDASEAAAGTAILVMCACVGMVGGGWAVDRLSRHDRMRLLSVTMAYCLFLAITLFMALGLGPGIVQFVMIGVGMSMSSAFLGPVLTVAADVTPEANRAAAFAIFALACMLIGGAPGPFVVGWLADITDLKTALLVAPAGALIAPLFLYAASKTYLRDRERVRRM